jgi:Zn-dependent protease with chaperone function
MQALTVDEFKRVLTHEFGHYHSGDVALGPWIHKTQAAMARTIIQLSENVLRFVAMLRSEDVARPSAQLSQLVRLQLGVAAQQQGAAAAFLPIPR